ncbi:MAG: tetratricopeptide repeat protein, partial [Gammaproteobacteria bacterium]
THNKQAYDAYLKGVYYLDDSNRTGDTAELAQSVPLFKQAVQFDPQFADAWAYLSLAYEKLGGQHKAQAAAALRALEIDPNNASALGVMSFVYSDEGQHDKAIALAERAVKLQTKNANVQAGLGFILMFAGRFDDAINIFEHAVALTPNTSTFRLFLAYPLEATRDYMQARDQLQTGLAHDPGDMSSVQMLAQVDLLGWGDLDAARKVLQAASQSPNRSIPLAEAWYQVDLYAREYAAALDVINHAPEQMFQQSQTPKAQYLAQVYQAQDDAVRTKIAFGQARTQLETWLKATPNSADLHANLALTMAGLDDTAQAQAEAERAVVLSPVARNAWEGQEYLLTQAQVQASIGHVDIAVEQLQHLLQIPAGSFISVPILKLDPAWDPIRKDPRFQALLKKYENTNHNSGSANGE